MKTLLLWMLIGVLGAVPCRGQSPDAPPGTRVFTSEELAQAGALRLSDLFTLLDDWNAYSLDGYTWRASAGGLAPARAPNWTLLVDGQPIDLTSLGTSSLETLPLHLSQVDSVEVTSVPTLRAGQFAPAGVIHLHTSQPADGLALRGGASAGNEVGDPGPYRYTDLATPNIDRIGPNYYGAASYGTPRAYARLSFKGNEHYATDTQIRERILRYYDSATGPPLLVLLAPRLALGTRGRWGRHQLQMHYSRLRDLRFLEPIGYEIPAQRNESYVGINGDFAPGSPRGLRYRLSYAVNDLDPRAHRTDLRFDWRQDRLRGGVEQRAVLAGWRPTVGVSFDYDRSRTGCELADPSLLTTRLYSQIDLHADDLWSQQVSAVLSRTDDAFGVKALATTMLRPAPAHTLSLALSFAHRPFAEQNDLWYWIRQGYALPWQDSLQLTLPEHFSTPRTFTADLRWRTRFPHRLRLTLVGAFRQFSRLNLARYEMGYDTAHDGFAPMTTVQRDVNGRVWRGALTVRWRPLPTLEQRLYYGYQHPVSSDAVFREAWRSEPSHRFSYAVRFAPIDRFSVHGRLAYHAPTRWPSYRRADQASMGRYPSRLPSFWRLDLTAQKKLWRDHLRAILTLRNALNEPMRLHPASAVSRMMLFVSLRARF